jgi:RNA polymerase sigma factor (sigma-70 family)
MDNDRELILQCLNRDIAAQNELYARLEPRMHAICRQYARSESEAEDILQTGFLKLFKNLHQYRFEGSFEGWVRRIIVNTAINFNRQQLHINHDVNIELLAYDTPFCEDALSKLSAKDLEDIIREMPHSHWAVFNLHEIEGYEHKEIGTMLGISEGTSKSQLHRAKVSIRRKLRELGLG